LFSAFHSSQNLYPQRKFPATPLVYVGLCAVDFHEDQWISGGLFTPTWTRTCHH